MNRNRGHNIRQYTDIAYYENTEYALDLKLILASLVQIDNSLFYHPRGNKKLGYFNYN